MRTTKNNSRLVKVRGVDNVMRNAGKADIKSLFLHFIETPSSEWITILVTGSWVEFEIKTKDKDFRFLFPIQNHPKGNWHSIHHISQAINFIYKFRGAKLFSWKRSGFGSKQQLENLISSSARHPVGTEHEIKTQKEHRGNGYWLQNDYYYNDDFKKINCKRIDLQVDWFLDILESIENIEKTDWNK